MTKFNVGDKVRITVGLGENEVGVIVANDYSEYPYRIHTTSGDFYWKHASRVVAYRPKRKETDLRLAEAEAKIAALEVEVETMKCQIYSLEKNKADTPALSAITQRTFQPKKTPNQRRADVIKRAQAFVADLEERTRSFEVNRDGNELFNDYVSKLTFHINADKGVVTALAHDYYNGKLLGKAFAKCAPGDVFNVDIGKAVAAGRLYGVKVPKEFTNAPKPTEAVVGMRVKSNRDWLRAALGPYYIGDVFTVIGRERQNDKYTCHPASSIAENSEIIEDTNAVYE